MFILCQDWRAIQWTSCCMYFAYWPSNKSYLACTSLWFLIFHRSTKQRDEKYIWSFFFTLRVSIFFLISRRILISFLLQHNTIAKITQERQYSVRFWTSTIYFALALHMCHSRKTKMIWSFKCLNIKFKTVKTENIS